MIDDKFFSMDMQQHRGYRYAHDCPTGAGRDKPLVVTRIATGWKWFCHRCGEKGIKWAKGLSPKEWLKFNKAREVREHNTVSKVKLPHGMTSHIPAVGLAWLYQYHLSDEDISYYGIGYSNTLNRVVLPVYGEDGTLLYYQARNLAPKEEWDEKNPKYMNVKARTRQDIYFKVAPPERKTDEVVVVEDIISGIRVGKQYDCYSLLNAYIPDELIFRLCKDYPETILWLDPDKWDRMLKRTRRFRSLGLNVKMVRVNQDPKYYTDEEIGEILMEV
jgi:DNA primase